MASQPSSVMLIAFGAFVLGAVVGSFLNVVIARIPRKQSLLTPPSRCLSCQTAIRWFDNVPLLSFLWLKGRCRACGSPVGWRYPVVEGMTGALFTASVIHFGPTRELIVALLFLSALVVITAIDVEHQLIPDRITLPGIAAGFVASLFTLRVSWLDSLEGILVGGGIFLVIILVSGGGMGGGDMKLGAMIGAFLGWKLSLLALLVAVLLGGMLAAFLLLTGRRKRKDPVPFGPFLAVGSVVGLFWGEELLRWYLGPFGS